MAAPLTTAAPTTATTPTFNRLLAAGVGGGAVGGLAAAAVLLGVGEASIEEAIRIEEANAVPGEAHEEVYSRLTQVIGGSVGLVLVGLLIGIVFAVVFARARHRLPGATDFVRARWLGLAGFAAVIGIPAIKYPANPPAVGDPDTVGARTAGYGALIALSIIAVAVTVRLAPGLRRRVAPALVAPLAALPAVALLAVAFLVLPDAVPADISAELLWRFRLASLAGQAALWAGLAVAFGALVERTARD